MRLSPAAVRPADQADEALTFHEILGTGIALSHADDSLNLLVLEILVHFQLVLHLEQLLVLGGGIALLLVDEKNDYFLEVIVDLSIATIVLQVLVALPGRVVVGLAFPSNLTRSARSNSWEGCGIRPSSGSAVCRAHRRRSRGCPGSRAQGLGQ